MRHSKIELRSQLAITLDAQDASSAGPDTLLEPRKMFSAWALQHVNLLSMHLRAHLTLFSVGADFAHKGYKRAVCSFASAKMKAAPSL